MKLSMMIVIDIYLLYIVSDLLCHSVLAALTILAPCMRRGVLIARLKAFFVELTVSHFSVFYIG
jgi:hypothetical protein